jgi:hypothetical protein
MMMMMIIIITITVIIIIAVPNKRNLQQSLGAGTAVSSRCVGNCHRQGPAVRLAEAGLLIAKVISECPYSAL